MPNPNTRYINQFFALRTAPELLPYFAGDENGAAKEVTEAFGLLRAYEKHTTHSMKNPDVKVVIVGDGVRPRCGATFAYLTKASVISIDPNANLNFPPLKAAQRLTVIKSKIEDVIIHCDWLDTVLILPHSHADMNAAIQSLSGWRTLDIINMPCCVNIPANWSKNWDIVYVDEGIWTPKNKIYVWNDVESLSKILKMEKK